MRATRTRFSTLKQRYELLKMQSAYIAAEREIMKNPSLTQWDETIEFRMKDGTVEFHRMNAEQFAGMEMDEFGNMKNVTVKDLQIRKLEERLDELEELGRKLLNDEKYELMREAQEIYDRTKSQLDRLRGNS